MKIIRSLDAVPSTVGSVVTIGNFDGVHLGHARILDTLREHATKRDLPAVAMTFEPHPLVEIDPARAPTLISTSEQRIRLIEARGVDLLFIQHFDRAFSTLSPEDFISRYLVDAFRARLLCVGHNFRFGFRHEGNVETLESWKPGFDVIEVPQVTRGGHAVSSSLVRQCLNEGDVSLARRLLGRCYEIEGDIVTGTGRGRRETVPTLNLEARNPILPSNGVYSTRIHLPGKGRSECPWLDSVTNIGTRPTFDGVDPTVETFIPLHDVDVTSGPVRLQFFRRLRDERRFEDAGTLKRQIERDIAETMRFFRRLGSVQTPGTDAEMCEEEVRDV